MSKISIIVPVYNVEHYLPRCINSVISQTYEDWELLLINDGSIDNSGSICDNYAIYDDRIKVYHRINGGVSAARNYGLTQAIGDWIMFLDSDDWLSQDCLEVCFSEVTRYDLDILQFSINKVYNNGHCIPIIKSTTSIHDPSSYLKQENINVCAGASMYHKSTIRDYNIIFDESLRLAEDQLFVLMSFRRANRIKFLNRPMYFYFQNDSSAVHNQRSCDLVRACEKLTSLANDWKPAKLFVDTMCMVFLTELVKLREVSVGELTRIYKTCSPQKISKKLPTSVLLFYKIAIVSPTIAVYVLALYFKIKHQ